MQKLNSLREERYGVVSFPRAGFWGRAILALTAAVALAGQTRGRAHVVEIQIQQRSAVRGGARFGDVGEYEKLVGTVTFAVKPNSEHNRQIVDLALAPTNAEGEVEFSSHFVLFRPKDFGRGNGALLLEISNRGGVSVLSVNRQGEPVDGGYFAFGTKFLLERGYTVGWIGWQADLPETHGFFQIKVPVARAADGSALVGLARADFAPWMRADDWPLGHVVGGNFGGKGYPPRTTNTSEATLTVRDTPGAAREKISSDHWRFARLEHGSAVENRGFIALDGGFQPGRIYEVVYPVEAPRVAGLGFAAVRDFVSFLKYDHGSPAAVLRAYSYGASQSGRFLRHFVYQDFNVDEGGKRVFDGIIAHVAGAGRGSFNHRFAQQSRDASPMQSIDYPTDLFPFTDEPERDPLTGNVDGLLDRARASGTVPRMFLTNTAYEYWGRAASLTHTTPDGKEDAAISRDVRIFFFAGVQHFSPALGAPRGEGEMRGQHPENPNPFNGTMRALLDDLDQWVAKDVAPPDSRYPHIGDGTLVPVTKLAFPLVPGIGSVPEPQRAYHLDFGPQWPAGIITLEPPQRGAPFPVLVPQVDKDGNELAGIRPPQLQVPLATYTGWDLRDPTIGAPTQRASFVGAVLPFPRTRAEAEASHDPRQPIADRYANKTEYLQAYEKAAKRLIAERFLLSEDLPEVLKRGAEEWNLATKTKE